MIDNKDRCAYCQEMRPTRHYDNVSILPLKFCTYECYAAYLKSKGVKPNEKKKL